VTSTERGPATDACAIGRGSGHRAANATREFAAALRHLPADDLADLDVRELWEFLITESGVSMRSDDFCERLRYELHHRRALGLFGRQLAHL